MGILTVASKPQEVTLSSTVSTTVTYNYVELRIYLCFGIVLTSRYKRPHTVPFMFVSRIPYPHRYKQKKTLSSKQDKRQLVHHVIVAPLYIQKLFSHSARIIFSFILPAGIFDTEFTELFPDLPDNDKPGTTVAMHQSLDESMYWLAGQEGILLKVRFKS